jgi:hypothetical protein
MNQLREPIKAIRRHCWKYGPSFKDGCSSTCMLEDGHEGPHEWTRDDQIFIRFSPLAKPDEIG